MPKMMPTIATPDATPNAATSVTRLEWDSVHFGFQVGRIAGDVSDVELEAALVHARKRAFRLVYWATAPDRQASPQLLADFGGQLVDQKVTFARALHADEAAATSGGLTIVHYGKREISDELTDLSIAAGEYSRFAVDPRVPRDRFEEMYRIWIAASVCGEMAGTVLIARDLAIDGDGKVTNLAGKSSAGEAIAGMITIKVTDGVGNIGLIAVSESHRGRGIGSRLIEAAHAWMIQRGASKTTVVTQAANVPACALYRRAGYAIEHAENYYHFWP
jgi:dTDP-4-amino-4,6-dideoxy-D-galactose acyltransferase